MNNLFLAKSKQSKTIMQHTNEVLEHYEILKSNYPRILSDRLWGILHLALKYHDFGKINSKFQNKIYKTIKNGIYLNSNIEKDLEIPHGYLSPAFLDIFELEDIYSEEELIILCCSIFYHHYRKSNLTLNDTFKLIKKYIEEDLSMYLENFCDQYGLDTNNLQLDYDLYVDSDKLKIDLNNNNGFFKKYVLVKGLLNRCDYAASAGIKEVEQKLTDESNDTPNTLVLKMFKRKDYCLRPLQKYMQENSENNVIVIASTGMGKTEASLLWANGEKTFFTLPLRVAINAMYQRLKSKEDINFSKTALLHSSALAMYLKEENDYITASDALEGAKLFSYPLTICTVDQLFRFIFKYQGFEKVLATLSYSRVVIDEIQMYSPDIVASLLIGLSYIQKMGGKFVIVTATLPKIFELKMQDLELEYVLGDNSEFLTPMNRHKIQVFEQELDLARIADLAKNKTVLVIANTVSKAQQYFRELNIDNKRLLHSRFIKKDRKQLEDDIRKFAPNPKKDNKLGVWVTTQIVEASLDLDFDVLVTEMCSVDSLFQRMGRVYRNRVYTSFEPNIYIYINNNGAGTVIDSDIYSYSAQAVKQYNNKLLTEQNKQEIMNKVYDPEDNPSILESNYFRELNTRLKLMKNVLCYELSKDDAIKNFRDIMSCTVIPESIYLELEESNTIEKWCNIMEGKSTVEQKTKVLEEIKEHVLSISYVQYFNIDRTEAIYKGSKIYRCQNEYSAIEGLSSSSSKNTKNYDCFFA